MPNTFLTAQEIARQALPVLRLSLIHIFMKERCQKIHEGAMAMLERTGMKYYNP